MSEQKPDADASATVPALARITSAPGRMVAKGHPGPRVASTPPDAGQKASEPDARDAEIATLRARLAALEARPMIPGLSADRGPLRLYRVSVPGFRGCRAVVTVVPHDVRAPDALKRLPTVSFDVSTELMEDVLSGASPQAAAWKRYAADHDLGAEHRRFFRVQVEARGLIDSMDIPAHSPYDASATFCKFHGITASTEKFSVEPVGDTAA